MARAAPTRWCERHLHEPFFSRATQLAAGHADILVVTVDSTEVEQLRATHRLTYTGAAVLARLLSSRSELADDTALSLYLDPKLSHLTPPHAMADREAATSRLVRAVRAGERIAVFGDYDCDGITATAVLSGALTALGGSVSPVLATRTEGAYGFSAPALERIKATSATLLVTCDCGSTDHERVEAAKKAGIDTIVIDHHIVPKDPLPALAFLNPHRPECGFPFKHLASCGLALSVSAALRHALGKELDVRQFLDLVAIGTIADVAPLVGDNRALVKAGLRVLGSGRRPGLRALCDLARIDLAAGVSAEDVAFRVAPRINAPGRLGDPDDALALLLTADRTTAASLAASVEQIQLRRRAVQAQMFAEALEDVREARMTELGGIVLARDSWHPGVVGIVAGKIAEELGKPTIVIGLEGATGRGSVRGPGGFPLYDALALCKAELVQFGGHQAAAGVHVRAERIDALRALFSDTCTSLRASLPEAPAATFITLDPRDDPTDVLQDLDRLEPFGEGNPAPRLRVPNVLVRSARNLKGHLKLDLVYEGSAIGGIFFSRGDAAESIAGRTLDVIASLRPNTFLGGAELQVHATIPDVKSGQVDAAAGDVSSRP